VKRVNHILDPLDSIIKWKSSHEASYLPLYAN
jgi:hypothetical protein